MSLTFGSLFAGVGGFDIGLERAGMHCLWQVEIDAKCRQVLAKHWPDVQRWEDVRDVGRHNLESVDVICGGFPCQDVSVAGRRAGLAGKRSGLWHEFHRVLAECRSGWAIIENVPGLLSSNQGQDFAVILSGLVELGYGVAWRIFDAQFAGVAQRRRRVFIVGHLGDGRAAEVLFERTSRAWDSPPSRETGQGATRDATSGALHSGTPGRDASDAGNGHLITPCLSAHHSPRYNPENEALIAFDWQSGGDVRLNISETHTSALSACQVPGVMRHGVRRLTPTEACRLQGFADDWNDGQSDSARYRQLGNAVAVPCAHWLGRRILEAL